MERRRFLQLGAASSAAVAGGTGCSTLLGGSESSSATSTQLGGFFAKLDAAMDAIANGKPFDELFADEQPTDEEARAKRAGEKQLSSGDRLLVQKALRSLLLVGALHELPEEARHHPGMVTRLNAGMKEMDEAIFGMTDLLEGMSPGDRVELTRRIERDPELPRRVAESLDTEAGKLGMPLGRRLRLRKLASHVSWRLRKQPPEAMLDEYTSKVRKLAARSGYDAELQRELAARASSAALFSFPAVAAGPFAGSQPADPDPGPAPGPAPVPDPAPTSAPVEPAPTQPLPGPSVTEPVAAPAPAATAAPAAPGQGSTYFPAATENQEATEEEDDSGEVTMTVGGVIMGVAAALGIVGGILVGTGSIAGAFLLTGGGILLLIGLIVLIVGAVMAA